ncbi:MAG: hypothetical protein IPN15_05410 [Saprospiraceae bacterium]|nr:hypothetical protein [Candidatus Vicinibacter affinis]
MENRRKCIITGSNAIAFNPNRDEVYYSIQYFDKTYTFHFCPKCYNKKELRDYSHIIRSVILNSGLPEITKKLIHWDCNVKGDFHLDLKEGIKSDFLP